MGWKKKTELDFDITCPIIDGAFEGVEEEIWKLLQNTDCSHLIDKLAEAIRPHLERVRKTNIDMRKAAEEQLQGLTDEIEALESKMDDKNREYESDKSHLEKTIDLMADEMWLHGIVSQYHQVHG